VYNTFLVVGLYYDFATHEHYAAPAPRTMNTTHHEHHAVPAPHTMSTTRREERRMGITSTKKAALLLFFDIAATYAAYWLAALLTDVSAEVFVNNEIFFMIGILAIFNVALLAVFQLYNNLWEYASVDEVFQILFSIVLSTFVGAVFLWVIDVRLPIRLFFVASLILIFLIGGTRLIFRIIPRKRRTFGFSVHDITRPRTLIVGAGETGSLTIGRMLSKDPFMPGIPIVATDDDPTKHKQYIHGVRVEGTSEDIIRLVEERNIEQIVVAIPSATLEERKRIYGICTKTECRLRTLPNIRELTLDEIGDVTLRDVDVADLLGREEIILNTRSVSGYIAGQTILVTGGGGSIGSELCRQLCRIAPKRIVIFDIYENDAYMLKHELLADYDDIDIVIEVGSVCDEVRVDSIFERYKPGVVFHAAAHKHVSLMERCPREAVQNNVFGTLNAVHAADKHGVARFIFVSTDKAVNPTSVMGATKRMGEMVVQHYASTSKTVFAAVRFGNVLGSNGSVIPIFQRQIAAGGPITVTHPDVERYFMTISEATRLVIQAGGMAAGGEIFILDMGDPVKIVDLAKGLIQLSGFTPGDEIKIEFVGLRKGEKMYEELLMNEESTLPTDNSSIMISTGQEISYGEVADKLEDLRGVLRRSDEEAITVLEQAVPTYTHTANEE